MKSNEFKLKQEKQEIEQAAKASCGSAIMGEINLFEMV